MENFRSHIAKFIIIANISFFLLLIILFVLNGFTPDEFDQLLKILIPINILYLTTVIKFVISQQKRPNLNSTSNYPLKPTYGLTVKIFVYTHVFVLAMLSVFCAFNLLGFDSLLNILTIVESFFSVFIGLIIADLFNIKDGR